MTAVAPAGAIGRLTKGAIALAMIWIGLVLIVAIVQSTTYTGWVAALSEWQFDHLGQSFTTMTFLGLIALLALPGLLLLGWAIRRINVVREVKTETLVIQRSMRMLLLLSVIAGLLGIAAAIFLIQWAMLPGGQGKPQRIDLRTLAGRAPYTALKPIFSEGATQLAGQYRYDRIATFRHNVLIAQRDYRFVPVQPPGAKPGSVIAMFAETGVLPDLRQATVEAHIGVLRRGGLPPAVAQLYRDAGFSVAPSVYVLYFDRRALTWPYIAGAIQLAVAALLLAIAALLTRRRLHLLRNPPPASADVAPED